ncbi:sodium:solute symporter family protein [Myxococcota bacterium]|nr:sodium:solute symporter family protein [Myxococcota bacterium]
MSFGELGTAALFVYMLALVGIAEIARRARRDRSASDHFLAGRELSTFVLLLTLYATAYSGNSLLGYPGEAYRRGFSWIMATGFMMSIIVAFHALVPKLRPVAVARGFVTPGDWIRFRFGEGGEGRALRVVIATLMALALSNFLFAQLKALGEMAEQVTGGIVSYEVGVILLATMVLFYETLGGMRAVAWTDAAQGLLMMVGLMALGGWLLMGAGGFAELTRGVAQARPDAVLVPPVREQLNWASTILLMGLASVLYPQAIQRIFAAKDGRTLRRTFAWMTFMPLTTTLVVTLIGLAAIPRFAGLADVEADRVMPLLLGEWSAVGGWAMAVSVAVFLGALAAIMSTADSVLLSLGSLVAQDLLGHSEGDARTTAIGKRVGVIAMAGMAMLALWAREVTLWGVIELKMELLIQCVPAFLLALHWKGQSARATIWGAVLGTAIAVLGLFFGVKRFGGIHVGVIGLALNLAVVWIGSRNRFRAG